MNKILAISLISAAFIIAVIFSITIIRNSSTNSKICINQSCFIVDLAKTSQEHARGLMFRESLAENQGMLFIYPESQLHSFWMKNTLMPLDIIWINNNQVVYIYENATPCNTSNECNLITPVQKANQVLEINSGKVKELNINIGDKVSLSL